MAGLFAVASVGGLAGCCATSKQVMALQEEQAVLRAKVDSLRNQQQQVVAAIGTEDGSLRELRATVDYKFSQLDDRIQAMVSSMGQSDSRFAKLAEEMEELNRRSASGDTTGAALGRDVLDAADADLVRGNYDLAEEGYLQFLRRNPASMFADDAQYGIAECYYGRQKYPEAIREYQRLVQLYPDGDKVPAALLKLGLAYQNLNKLAEAKKQWEALIEKYPQSSEAALAKDRLKNLPKL
jgi:tol-pal system protein YbgF